jgi:putative PIN family toxin of toxin-antitoxin system
MPIIMRLDRVLTDTNILISALLNSQGNSSQVLKDISENHQLVLSDYNLSELREVTQRKFPQKSEAIEAFLGALSFELIVASISPDSRISDPKDAPILNAAIEADVDIIVSGDAHFQNLTIKKPVVVAPAEYLRKYSI